MSEVIIKINLLFSWWTREKNVNIVKIIICSLRGKYSYRVLSIGDGGGGGGGHWVWRGLGHT